MSHKPLTITPMTEHHAHQISHWKYEGEYSLYDHNEGDITGYMDGTHYACTNTDGKLVGYFCFGKDAQIPTVEENVYCDEYLDIGLGLRLDACGKGFGLFFLNEGMDYARRAFGTEHFRLSVAVFNERAIKVYKKAGFHTEREVTNSYSQKKFLVMKCIR